MYYFFAGLVVGALKAVQHLLNEVGYMGMKVGDKSEDPGAVAMEMTPDEVQWLKVYTCMYLQFVCMLVGHWQILSSCSLPLFLLIYSIPPSPFFSVSQGASSKTHDLHDQIKQLNGCRVVKVCAMSIKQDYIVQSQSHALHRLKIRGFVVMMCSRV